MSDPKTVEQWQERFAADFPRGFVMTREDEVEDETGGTYPVASVRVTGLDGTAPKVFFVAVVGQGVAFDGTIIGYDPVPDIPKGYRVVFAEWDHAVVWSGEVSDQLWNGFKEAGLL